VRLHPDKIALATLYYLDSVAEPEDEPAGIASALGKLATGAQVAAQLRRLEQLGLVIESGPYPIARNDVVVAGMESWTITHDGSSYVHKLIRQPKSFLYRLHSQGLLWLATTEAERAQLTTKLDTYSVRDVLEGTATDVAAGPSTNSSVNWNKWGAIFAGLAIVVAIAIAVLS
jgi:hypothetical protein